MDDSLIWLSATELATLTRSGDISARQAVSAHLDRIEEVNGAVNALVAMRPRSEVLADADAADSLAPARRGPLHGLPVAVKDLEAVAGLPTRCGSLVTSAEPAAADGLLAARLRAAGAVIVAKTNTPEFGTGSHTFNEVYGITRNPWDLSRSAGGSSGGAAAALATRMLALADGSDLGGSLRNPAAWNNVVGLRPSLGRVPEQLKASSHLLRLGVLGPMGRTVGDTALLLSVMAGADPGDPISLGDGPAVFARPLPSATDAVVGWIGDVAGIPFAPEPFALARAAAELASAAGGAFTETAVDLSGAEDVFRVMRGLAYRNLGTEIGEDRQSLLKQTVRDNIAYGRSLTVDDVLRAERLRARLHTEMTRVFAEVDVLALPTTQLAPFPVTVEYPTEIEGRPMADYLSWMMSNCLITPTGCPAISIPAGFTADGLPAGLQLVAPVNAERRLLEVAAALEAANPLSHLRPPLNAQTPGAPAGARDAPSR